MEKNITTTKNSLKEQKNELLKINMEKIKESFNENFNNEKKNTFLLVKSLEVLSKIKF